MKEFKRMTKDELEAALSRIESEVSAGRSVDEYEKTVYELQIHQIELEMQNRELADTQELLHDALNRYSDLYDFAPIGYLTLDDVGQIKECNLTAAAMLGIERFHLIRRYITRYMDRANDHIFREHLHQCKTTQARTVSELRLLLGPDRTMDVELTSVPVIDKEDATSLYRTSMSDITVRRQAQNEAIRERESSELLINSSNDGIFAVDRECKLTRWNPAMERIFSVAKSQALGKCVYDVLPFIRQIGEDKYVKEALSGRVAVSHFKPLAPSQGPAQRYFEAQYSPLVESPSHVIGIIAIIRDVTDHHNIRKHIEQLNTDLHRKNRELETILSVASHDIRGPLVNVQGFSVELARSCESLSVLLDQAGLTDSQKIQASKLIEDIQSSIGFIQSSATAVDVLLKNLMAVTKAGLTKLTIKNVEMNAVLSELMRSLEYKLKQVGAAISIEQLPACSADENQIKQVFSNLVDNAIKYLDPSRPGRIRVSGFTQGDTAIYCVEDNGVGIPEQKKEQVFESFLRLDESTAKGEGLGLAIVRRIVEKHRGRVWVESEPGKGSKFYVSLPL